MKEYFTEGLIRDIVERDVRNWWRAVAYWEETRQFDDVDGKKVLDIGGMAGGGIPVLGAEGRKGHLLGYQ